MIVLTWSSHVSLLEIWRPKLQWLATSVIIVLFRYIGNRVGLFGLFVINMKWVFWGLKVTLHWSAHLDRWSNWLLIVLHACAGLVNLCINVVSSTYWWHSRVMSSAMSLIKIKNRSGPRIDPCGTPVWIRKQKSFFLQQLLFVANFIECLWDVKEYEYNVFPFV